MRDLLYNGSIYPALTLTTLGQHYSWESSRLSHDKYAGLSEVELEFSAV